MGNLKLNSFMTATTFLRCGAREILNGIAYDLAIIYDSHQFMAGQCDTSSLWNDARRIEKRFKLTGYTSAKCDRYSDVAKLNRAMRKIKSVNSLFEPCEIDRMCKASALSTLRDMVNSMGRLSFCERFGTDAYKEAISYLG